MQYGFVYWLRNLLGLIFKITALAALTAITLGSAKGQDQRDVIRIVVPDYPPYVFKQNAKWQGETFQQIQLILDKLDLSYQLIPAANFGKAFDLLKSNQGDLVLLASENEFRNQYAVFSAPVACVQWNWYLQLDNPYLPEQVEFRQKYVIASPHDSNQYVWLKQHNYKVEGVMKLANMAKMMAAKRINAVMVNQAVFENAANVSQVDLNQFKVVKHSARAAAMYVSKTFLKRHPNFMDELNQSIKNNQHNPVCTD